MKDKEWIEIAIVCALAIYGSISNVVMRNLNENRTAKQLLTLSFLNSIIAGFAGIMSYTISKSIHADFYVTLMIAGMAGFMGGHGDGGY